MALFRSQSFLSCFDLYLVLLYSIDNKFEFTTELLWGFIAKKKFCKWISVLGHME